MRLDYEHALERLQAAILDILDVFAAFCEAHDLEWFLDSGSVLGAMRHDGFIPWDDDADVGMLRPEYERFLSLAAGREIAPGYSVHTIRDTEGFDGIMAKVFKDGTAFVDRRCEDEGYEQAIFIDVFPYDPLLADERARRRQLRFSRFWLDMLYLRGSGRVNVPHRGARGATERLACALANPVARLLFSKESALRHFEATIPGPDDDVCDLYSPLPFPLQHPKDTLVPVSYHEFCGRNFPLPADPDAYLTLKYRDWRKLPPVEARKSHLPTKIDFGDGDYYEGEGGYALGGIR